MSRAHMRTPDPGISFGHMDHHRDYRFVVYRPTHTNDIKYADIMIRLSSACWRLTDNRVLNIL